MTSGPARASLAVDMMLRRFLFVSVLLLWAAAAFGQRSLVIEDFYSDILVMKDGTINVTETISPHFTGSWNGIYRTIPVRYRTPQGFDYRLFLNMLSITDGEGRPLKYERRRFGNYQKFKVWVPDAFNATRTVVLNYTVPNGLKFFDDHDELYWNVTGDEWEFPILSAGAEILLPAGVKNLRAVAFTGGYGSTESAAKVEIAENLVTLEGLRPLNFREGLTVAVAWDPGLVSRPGPLRLAGLFLRSNWIFSVPLIVFLLMFCLWYKRGRDPRLRPIAPQYEPPDQMTPAEVGTLVDNSPDMRDITSTIVDLAVRGYLVIEGQPKEHWSGLSSLSKMDYTFTLRKKPAEWKGLQPHEEELLRAVFSAGTVESVSISELENRFYLYLPSIHGQIFDRLIGRRYYLNRPDKVKQGYLAGAVVIGIVAVLGAMGADSVGLAPAGTAVAGVLSAGLVAVFGAFMPARTYGGARALEGVLGFEEFLNRVESDRFERIVKTPEMFEKFLPFAMALGVEKNWAKAFADIYREPPEWYRGSGFPSGFYVGSFVSDLGHMSTQTSAAMISSPRSSGGSGFGGGGGGGSSGGGFGGGGGGGF